jgi:abhydrolase domain-containing protein 6
MLAVIKRWWLPLTLLVVAGTAVALWYLSPEFAYRVLAGTERLQAGVFKSDVMIQDRQVVYFQGGEGDDLLLLHGFMGSKEHWTPIAGALSRHFRVTAPDLPGFGESALVAGSDYSIPAQVERIRLFADALGLEEFWLGGSSMGGNIAGAFAARYPERVQGLWLIAPLGVAGAEPSGIDRLRDARGKPPLIIERPEQFEEIVSLVLENRPWIPEPAFEFLARDAASRYRHYLWVDGQIRVPGGKGNRPATPLEPLLAGSEIPTLIMWGDKDRVLHVSGARVLADIMPNAEVEIMPDVGHLPMLEKPGDSTRAFLNFVARVGATEAGAPPPVAAD